MKADEMKKRLISKEVNPERWCCNSNKRSIVRSEDATTEAQWGKHWGMLNTLTVTVFQLVSCQTAMCCLKTEFRMPRSKLNPYKHSFILPSIRMRLEKADLIVFWSHYRCLYCFKTVWFNFYLSFLFFWLNESEFSHVLARKWIWKYLTAVADDQGNQLTCFPFGDFRDVAIVLCEQYLSF